VGAGGVVDGPDDVGSACTTDVAFDVTADRPATLDARSTTRIVWPTSCDRNV